MSTERVDAVIVGSGPNGLAAAVVLARAGLSVTVLEAQDTPGGGARTVDLGMATGLRHDLCSAVHPLALASPFFQAFGLAGRIELAVPEASYAQPMDDGGAIAWRDIARMDAELGADGPAWRRLLGPFSERMDRVAALALSDQRSLPPELLSLGGLAFAARFGARLGQQSTALWDHPLRGERARALLAGVAAHAIGRMPSVGTAAAALLLASAAHAEGWPVPVGGSQAIVDALIADLRDHGGTVLTGARIGSAAELPAARAHLLDTSVEGALAIYGDQIPESVRRSLSRLGHGNAAAKVDFVISGPVPWSRPEIGRAGTVHIGGTRAQMAAAEAEVAAGSVPERPVCLLSDPAVVDPSREVDGLRPLWTYAHVPAGCPVDPTEMITAQIERFAPGFRDLIVDSRAIPASRMHEHNENYIGGDIATGTISVPGLFARPRLALDPYALGVPGAYLCSAATPPGPAVHGMAGWHAARRVLAECFGLREEIALL